MEKIERQKRKYEEEKQEQDERQKNAMQQLKAVLGADTDEEMEAEGDASYMPPATRQKMAAPPPLHVPRDILLREGVQAAMTRNKISPQSMVDIWCAIVSESKGKVANYSINSGHVGKKRNQSAQASLEKEKKDWTPPDPSVRSLII